MKLNQRTDRQTDGPLHHHHRQTARKQQRHTPEIVTRACDTCQGTKQFTTDDLRAPPRTIASTTMQNYEKDRWGSARVAVVQSVWHRSRSRQEPRRQAAAGLLPQATRECERHGGGRRAPLSIQYSRLRVPATIAMGIEAACRAHSNSRATASRGFARCSPTAAHDHRQVFRWARSFNAPMACSAPAKRVDPRSNALKDVGATRLELGGVCRITRCVV